MRSEIVSLEDVGPGTGGVSPAGSLVFVRSVSSQRYWVGDAAEAGDEAPGADDVVPLLNIC